MCSRCIYAILLHPKISTSKDPSEELCMCVHLEGGTKLICSENGGGVYILIGGKNRMSGKGSPLGLARCCIYLSINNLY